MDLIEGMEIASSKLQHLKDVQKLDPVDRIGIKEAKTSLECGKTAEELIEAKSLRKRR